MKVLFRAMLVNALHAPLEDTEKSLNRVRVDRPTPVGVHSHDVGEGEQGAALLGKHRAEVEDLGDAVGGLLVDRLHLFLRGVGQR